MPFTVNRATRYIFSTSPTMTASKTVLPCDRSTENFSDGENASIARSPRVIFYVGFITAQVTSVIAGVE